MADDGFEDESDFDKLLQTSGKKVLIYAYKGQIPSRAKECVHAIPCLKPLLLTGYEALPECSRTPRYPTWSILLSTLKHRNGEEIKRVVGMDPAGLESLVNTLA
ncbi:hypothetical protein AC578_1609 [Pseudocercospora eumusae]|uniref:Uncharacterized protein n=1 Tax=Pseudocercospora eumusae TaxID=321146 RepID=A0A139HMB8_9PEZI|nr:hypothetical protein AC578_1609 [Pseudocercospora eumusae]